MSDLRFLFSLIRAVLLASLLLPAGALAEDRLLFAVDVIRHGDRTPLSELPAAPHRWEQGLGQLTGRGMRQEYELGARMRTVYVDRYHLLPSSYTAGTLYARSTDIDRTLMSAECFLTGLYPPGTGPRVADSDQPGLPDALQPIPIHTVDRSEDVLNPKITPEEIDALKARTLFSSPEWKRESAAVVPKFAAWSKATGVTLTSLEQLIGLSDTFLIYGLYHIPAPQGLSDEDVRTIVTAGRWAFAESFQPAEIGRLLGRGLLRDVADRLRQAGAGKSRLKYVLFSAHDSTLLAAMSALGAPLTAAPPYASRLNFALFDDGHGGLRVEISYNDQPVTVPACGAASCSLARFVESAK